MSELEHDIDMHAVAAFWAWFARITPTLGFPPARDAVDAIGDRVQALHPGLGFQIGETDDGLVLEISAEGRKPMIPVVVAVVNAAPPIAGWTVRAFRQPCAVGGIRVGDRTYTAESVRFAMKRDDSGTHLALFLDRFDVAPDEVGPIAFLLLDATIGELAVMTEIAGLDFFDSSNQFVSTRPLRELPAALDT
jgi:hypothetical protein